MHFVSIDWFFWMSGTVAWFWLLPAGWRFRCLVLATLAFLAIYSPQSAAILVTLTALTFVTIRGATVSGVKVAILTMAIAAILIVYKALVAAPPEDQLRAVVIPMGLAYYALRLIHVALERYKGALEEPDFETLVTYLFFLPTIVIGPIHRFAAFARDLRRHRWDARLVSEGLERVLYGYVKIAVLANYLVSGHFARFIGSLDGEPQALVYYLEIVRGGLNLYLQFSGFSDVAIGFARLLGFRVMENFNWPYLQKNIADFWRCWHISLTSWFRDYAYTSVFSLTRSPALGALATLMAIALWHEASLRYLVWGLYHGLGIVAWQQFQRLKPSLPTVPDGLPRRAVDLLSILFTVHFVWIGFIIVRQATLADSWQIITTLLLFWR